MSLSVYKRLPKRLPYSLGFKRYALYFNGSSYYVDLPEIDISGATSFTLEAFLKVLGDTGGFQMIGVRRNGYFISVRANYSALAGGFLGTDNKYYTLNIAPLPDYEGKIVHAVVVYDYDAGVLKGYLNGDISDTLSVKVDVYKPVTPCRIGADDLGRYFYGEIYLFRAYKGVALSRGEVRHNMLNYSDPIRDGLVLWLHDRITSDTWYDDSGYGNNGTIYGALRRNLSMWEIRAEVRL